MQETIRGLLKGFLNADTRYLETFKAALICLWAVWLVDYPDSALSIELARYGALVSWALLGAMTSAFRMVGVIQRHRAVIRALVSMFSIMYWASVFSCIAHVRDLHFVAWLAVLLIVFDCVVLLRLITIHGR